MGAQSDVRQGRAYVELYVKNSALIKGLADAKRRLMEFGAGIATVGKWMMGLGLAAIAPIAAMVGRFESVGSALNDMSMRTGMSTEALSELSYAASQTGAEIGDVEKAVRKMQKSIADAASGGKAGEEALAAIGLTAADLIGLSPDRQFDLVAEKIGKIADPTMRAAAALELFGKSGTALLPMIADMEALRTRARELGQVMSKEDAAAADALGDALGDLKLTIFNAGNGLSAALAPALTNFVLAATNAVKQVKQWAAENAGLIGTVLKVAGGVLAAGAGLFVFGKIIWGVGALIGGLHGFILWAAGGVQFLVGVLGMAISPALAIGVALVAAGAGLLYLARNTEPVKAAGQAIAGYLDAVRGMISTVVADATTAWDGIAAALSAGDIGAAVKVVTAAVVLEWTRVTTWLEETWQGFLSVWSGITTKIASFMLDSVASIRSAWSDAMTGMANAWDSWAATLIKSPLYRTITTKAVGLVMGDEFAKTMDDVMQKEAEATPQRIADRNASNDTAKAQIEENRKGQQRNLEEDRKAGEAPRAAKIDAAQRALADAEKARDAAVQSAKDKRDAAVAASAADSRNKIPGANPESTESLSAVSTSTAGTFNARAAAQMGGGGIQERILSEAKAAKIQREKSNKLSEDMLNQLRAQQIAFVA